MHIDMPEEVAKIREKADGNASVIEQHMRDTFPQNPLLKEALIARMQSHIRLGKPGEPMFAEPSTMVIAHLGEDCILSVICKFDGSCDLYDARIMRSFKPEDFLECQSHVVDTLKFFGEEFTQAP